jgi:hypothetical protein
MLSVPLFAQLPGINLPPPTDKAEADIPVIQNTFHAPTIEPQRPQIVAGYGKVMRGYVCQESIDRFRGEQALDTITALVSFERGTEDYRNIKRNGHPVKAIHSLSGAWSEADFGTMTEQPEAEWVVHVEGRKYEPMFAVSKRAGGVIVRETMGMGLPTGILKISWGIKHRDDGVPVNGWYQVSYNDGTYARNQMYWDHCRIYGAESEVTFQ